ncbi:Spore germination protein A1 [compost metagenome]
MKFKPNQEVISDKRKLMESLLEHSLSFGESIIENEWNDLILALLSGDTVVLIEGCDQVLLTGTKGGEWRSVTEPSSQLVVRGPKDSFVESIGTNISLIRRRIKSPNLWMESMKIGSVTHTHVAIMYLQGVADKQLVEEIKRRLKDIHIDGVLESAYIEEFIQDNTFTPFPTVFNTERPDVAAGNLLEGRVVLLVDGTPFVLILPTVFAQFFQSPEDYAQRYDISVLMRLIRFISFIILLLGPSVYIALTTFHYEMIPSLLLVSFMAQREGVPFPAFVEAMLMEVTFEILREAGVRMPRAIGQTVSIVGALILGQAVVEAGIITPIMVIVVALTGIASFALPAYNLSIAGRLFRFYFMVLGGMFGFYGITLGLIVLVAHMNSLRSFGVPYLTPISPFVLQSQKDIILRFPMWMQKSPKQSGNKKEEIRVAEEVLPQRNDNGSDHNPAKS